MTASLVCSQPPEENCPSRADRVWDENSRSEPVSTETEPTKDTPVSKSETPEKQPVGRAGKQPMEEEHKAEEVKPTDERQVEDKEEILGSPILDLDPSLDMEVMELMTTAPFACREKGRSLRLPRSSFHPSDDLLIRLRQSPFSTEASPDTSPARTPNTPPPLTPPSPVSSRDSPLVQVKCLPHVIMSPVFGLSAPVHLISCH